MIVREQLRIMTWNIKGSASFSWNNTFNFKKELINQIVDVKADIIVITEFVFAKGIETLFCKLENNNYIWFNTICTGKNGILIAINKDKIDIDINGLYCKNPITSNISGCNYLCVTVPMKCGQNLTIIGCRIEKDLKENDWKKQYDKQFEIYKNLLEPIISSNSNSENCIVCGDFNNAACRGNLNFKYNSDNYKNLAQINYNLNILNDRLSEFGFELIDKTQNGDPIITHKNCPLDHIFVRGFKKISIKAENHLQLSDHKMLISEVEIKN